MKKNNLFKTLPFLFVFFLAISFSGSSQGTACDATPTPITVNGSCLTGLTISDNNTNEPTTNGCTYNFRHEGWFTFSTTSTMNVVITGQSGNGNLYLQLVGGTCPGSLTQLACANSVTSGGQTETITYNNLASGTYYIRVVNAATSGGSMSLSSLCITGTIVCNSPATINTVTNITSTTASISWPAASPAPSSGYEWEVRTSGAGGSGATGLVASGTVGAGVTTANVTGLTASTTYYVYVRSNCGSSTYSTWRGPRTFTTTIANDDPCGATSLTVGTNCSTTTSTNVGATSSSVTAPSGAGACGNTSGSYAGGDVWFSLTIPANGSVQIDVFTGTLTDPVVAAYTASSCTGPFTFVGCDDDAGAGLESQLQLSGLTAGDTLYIRVWRWNGGGAGTFSICATSPSTTPPANDNCANATTLTCGDTNIAGTTSGASNTNPGVSCTMSSYGVWYTFTGTGDLFQVAVDPESGYDVELSISSGNCGAFSNVACVDNSGSGGLEYYEFVTTNGVDYYVYVADYISGSGPFDVGDFTISLSCQTVTPPPNDDPCGAIDLYVNANCVSTSGTTQYATATSGVPAPSCSGYSGSDVWYTVTVPPTAQITLSTQDGVVTQSGMSVYSTSSDCTGTFTEILCDTDASSGSVNLTAANGISPGQVLYIRVWEDGNDNNGSFYICATASVPAGTNDVEICLGGASDPMTTDLFCNTGTTIPNPLTGSITSSSPWADSLSWWTESNDPCSFDPSLPRKYDTIDFTVTADGTYTFAIDDANTSLDDTLGYIVVNDGLFTYGSCATGTYIAGDDVSGPGLLSEITATLSAGVNYTLVTTYGIGATTGSYEWDVDLNATAAEWYTSATGGTPVSYGAIFDPVGNTSVISSGVPYSALTDTNTAGTYSFWVACPGDTTRTQVDYVIVDEPVVSFSGSASCNSFDVTIDISQPGFTQWIQVAYTTDGGSTFTYLNAGNGIGVINSSDLPFTFTVYDTDVPDGSTLELFRIRWGTCIATYGGLSVSIPINYNCNCVTWDGEGTGDNWNDPLNWNPNGVPTLSDCVVIPSGYYPLILNGTTNAEALSITIGNGASITVENEMTLTVQDFINGPGASTGDIILEGSEGTTINSGGGGTPSSFNSSTTANLIQLNNTATNTAVVTLQRFVFTRTQDYVYWSSPVESVNPLSNFETSLVYEWKPTIFQSATVQFGNWIAPISSSMEAGKGYIARGPSGGTNETADWAMATFTGVPYNGIITQNIRRGTYTTGNSDPDVEPEDDNWNLVGNPYPSNLDADLFLQENATLIDGYINLWTHGIQIRPGNSPNFGDYVLNYAEEDYLVYNLGGSTGGGHGASFDGYLGSGQGFFVLMLDGVGTQVPSYPDEYETTIEFNNNMRTNQTEMFFRSTQQSENTSNLPTEKHRIWLDLIQPDYTYQTILVGYIQGATMYNDHFYDAKAGNTKSIYSLISGYDEKFAIQGRELPFDSSDIVSLGVTLNQVGEYAINLNSFDGLFETSEQDIFLEDLETGIIHDLRESAYFFTINETGTFNNRFLLRYTNTTLGIDDIGKHEIRIIAPNNEYIKVTSGINQIESVKVYDLLGRVLIEKQKVNATELTINTVPKTNGAYIVKARLTNGIEKIQKVVLK